MKKNTIILSVWHHMIYASISAQYHTLFWDIILVDVYISLTDPHWGHGLLTAMGIHLYYTLKFRALRLRQGLVPYMKSTLGSFGWVQLMCCLDHTKCYHNVFCPLKPNTLAFFSRMGSWNWNAFMGFPGIGNGICGGTDGIVFFLFWWLWIQGTLRLIQRPATTVIWDKHHWDISIF